LLETLIPVRLKHDSDSQKSPDCSARATKACFVISSHNLTKCDSQLRIHKILYSLQKGYVWLMNKNRYIIPIIKRLLFEYDRTNEN